MGSGGAGDLGPRLDLLGFTRRMAAAIVIGAVACVVALAFGHGSVARGPCRLPRCGSHRLLSRAAISRSPGATAQLPMSDADAEALR